MSELQYAQRVWGDSPQLQATIALTHKRLGNVRAGINAMKRAYPQYLAAGGETLPTEILQVIFPVDYWPLLQKYSKQRNLDPYLVAALVAQESNFDPVVRLARQRLRADADPAEHRPQLRAQAGRAAVLDAAADRGRGQRAPRHADLRRRRSASSAASTSRWPPTTPATAASCAWQREKPGLPQDEFIDDIPFPETQNYVKRILGTAEDYRYLYGQFRTAEASGSNPVSTSRTARAFMTRYAAPGACRPSPIPCSAR